MFYVATRDVDCEAHYFHKLENALNYISSPLVSEFAHTHPCQVTSALEKFVVATEGGFYELEPDQDTFGPMYSGWVQEVDFDDELELKGMEN